MRDEVVEHVVGVDLAAQPTSTGVAELRRVGDFMVGSLPEHTGSGSDDGLVQLVGPRTLVGLDAPLGWPTMFVDRVSAHARGERWPTTRSIDEHDDRVALRYRRTDQFVREVVGRWPLSASTDLIGVVALRGALLQTRWASRWGDVQPRDGSGLLVETYPVAALRAWGLLAPGDSYKSGATKERRADQGGVRRAILDGLASRSREWLRLEVALVERADESDHVLDALLCALVALASRVGATHQPDVTDVVLQEGWIHVPSVGLEELGERLVAFLRA